MKYEYKISATKDDFIRALSTEGLLNEFELRQLEVHYHQDGHKITPTELSKLLGEKSHQGVSVRNVWMAKKISNFLGINPPERKDGFNRWWAFLTIAEKKGTHWELQLKPEIVSAIEELELFSDKTEIIYPEEITDIHFSKEGALKHIQVNGYERDSKARSQCLKYYKRIKGKICCIVCEFDFEKAYGDLGKEFIHVHHIVPLYTIGQEYYINPEKDLVPVCPNCHAMLHRNKEVLIVDELKKIVNENKIKQALVDEKSA